MILNTQTKNQGMQKIRLKVVNGMGNRNLGKKKIYDFSVFFPAIGDGKKRYSGEIFEFFSLKECVLSLSQGQLSHRIVIISGIWEEKNLAVFPYIF